MPVQVLGNIDLNEVILSQTFVDTCAGAIVLRGKGSTIRIGSPGQPSNIYCTIDSGATIAIGENFSLPALNIHALAPGAIIEIGENLSCTGNLDITAHEPSVLKIGMNCLMAGGCTISTSDVHKIYDVATGKRINFPRDIRIGDRVWLGNSVSILKGADIGSDSIIGMRSIVGSVFPANSLIAGVPGRLLRSGIRWEP